MAGPSDLQRWGAGQYGNRIPRHQYAQPRLTTIYGKFDDATLAALANIVAGFKANARTISRSTALAMAVRAFDANMTEAWEQQRREAAAYDEKRARRVKAAPTDPDGHPEA